MNALKRLINRMLYLSEVKDIIPSEGYITRWNYCKNMMAPTYYNEVLYNQPSSLIELYKDGYNIEDISCFDFALLQDNSIYVIDSIKNKSHRTMYRIQERID